MKMGESQGQLIHVPVLQCITIYCKWKLLVQKCWIISLGYCQHAWIIWDF